MCVLPFNLVKGISLGIHIVENVGIYNGRSRIMASWWIVINNVESFKCSKSSMLFDTERLSV